VSSRASAHISSSHDSARSGGGHHPPKLGDKSGRREEEIFRPLPSSPEINSRAGSAEAEQLTSVGTQVRYQLQVLLLHHKCAREMPAGSTATSWMGTKSVAGSATRFSMVASAGSSSICLKFPAKGLTLAPR